MVVANLKNIVDQVVNENIDVQETFQAKQEVLDKVGEAHILVDGLYQSVATKKQEIVDLAEVKKQEMSNEAEFQIEFVRDVGEELIQEFDEHALHRTNQYDSNHATKLAEYNENDSIKMAQYNENHIERLENINHAYADRIVEMIKTRNFMGIFDEYVAKTATHMITFLDTTDANYIYYANGTLLTEDLDYTVYDGKTIELTVKANPYDVIVQVNTQVLADMLTAEGVLFYHMLGQPNGVASLNEVGQVPAEQLPSYVDDVIEVDTYADLPVEGEKGKIYVVITDETSNGDTSTYRWTGVVYAMVSNTLNASDVKALYEANPDTNVYTDAEKSSVDVAIALTTTAQTLPTAINELDTRVADIEDNTTLADYNITDAYTKTEVQETLPAVGLDTTNTVAPVRPGQIKWNQDEGTADLALDNGVTLQIGQENTRLVRNGTLSTISNMTVCMFDGTLGNSGRIKVAPFNGLFNQAHYVYGIATQNINTGEDGYITIDGKVRNFDTTGDLVGEVWVDGDVLYVNPNSAGRLTNVMPSDYELKMPIASVVHAHTNGTLEVRVLPFNENMIAKRADKWTTARTLMLSGDVSGSISIDGSSNVTMETTIQPDSVELGTDTTGNYVAGNIAGTGITISGTVGEGWSPIIAITDVGTAGTYTKVTTNEQGQVTAGTTLSAIDIPELDTSKITSGTLDDARLPDTITSDITGNAATATKLETARSIALTGDVSGNVNFDGSENISITTTVSDNSHKHTISNVEGLQDILSDLQENVGIITSIEEW